MKKITSLFLCAVVLMFSLTGCGSVFNKFADYNVAGYIDALLDSSYHGNHEEFVEFTSEPESEAVQNKTITNENGAIHFCNALGIFPSDEQMAEIQEIMDKAYKLTKYVVKKEVKTKNGYTVDVEIQPLMMFSELSQEFASLKTSIENGNYVIKNDSSANESQESSATEENEDDDYTEDDMSEDSQASETDSAAANSAMNASTIYVDEVIKLCNSKLAQASPTYGTTTTITLNILLESDGWLSLDRVQIGEIDETVINYKLN